MGRSTIVATGSDYGGHVMIGLVPRPDLMRRFIHSEARSVAREEAGQWVFEALGDETF